MITTHHPIFTQLTATISACLLLIACSELSQNEEDKASESPSVDVAEQEQESAADDSATSDELGNEAGAGEGELSELSLSSLRVPTVKVRNYQELYLTMAQLVGVEQNNERVRNEFEARISSALPTKNEADGYTPAHQVANFKLASLMCDESYSQTSTRSTLFNDVRVDDELESAVLSGAAKSALAQNLIDSLWQKVSAEEKTSAASSLRDLIQTLESDLFAGENSNDRNGILRGMAVSACAAVLSAAPITTY